MIRSGTDEKIGWVKRTRERLKRILCSHVWHFTDPSPDADYLAQACCLCGDQRTLRVRYDFGICTVEYRGTAPDATETAAAIDRSLGLDCADTSAEDRMLEGANRDAGRF